jgi:hypothetical protein
LLIQQYTHAGSAPTSFWAYNSPMTIGHLIPPLGDKKGKGKKSSSNTRPFTMAWYKQRGFYLTWDKHYDFIEKGFQYLDVPKEESRHIPPLIYIYTNA